MTPDTRGIAEEPRSVLSLALPIVAGSLIGIIGLQFLLLRDRNPQALDELALGPQTTTFWSKVESNPIHCGMKKKQFKNCLDAYIQNGKQRDVVLWLGNSQLHAINQFSEGDKSASFYLHNILRIRTAIYLRFQFPMQIFKNISYCLNMPGSIYQLKPSCCHWCLMTLVKRESVKIFNPLFINPRSKTDSGKHRLVRN